MGDARPFWPSAGGLAPASPTPRLAVDISNYTSPLTPAALRAWTASGIQRVVVQAVDPPHPWPTTQTQAQIQALRTSGAFDIQAYVYLWSASPGAIADQLPLLAGSGITRVWLDCEDTTDAPRVQRIDAIRVALSIIRSAGYSVGIYTGRWWWVDYLGNPTEFSDLPLWLSQYDDNPDPAAVSLFGGWTSAAMKQYRGTSIQDGVAGVDLNAY